MKFVSILGYTNVTLFTLIVLLGYFNTHKKQFKFNIPNSFKYHKYFAGTLLVTAIIHSYLATGYKYFHPGIFLYLLLILNITFMKLFKKTHNKIFYTLHTKFPYIMILAIIGHVLSVR